tara:strand:+ start:26451 stop:27398 length:948 start_codon:yes stop_codon:yes gene_type:complete
MGIIEERQQIYNLIRENCNVFNDRGIFFNINIDDRLLSQLQRAFVEYIHKTLLSFYGKKIFLADWRFDECDFDFLNVYEQEIFALPNISPNGVFYPKRENLKEYNKLQAIVTDILIDTGLINYISHAQCITPRIVSGRSEEVMRSRLLATEKYHSDAWASQLGDSILSIPVGGDPTTTVELCEPVDPSPDFFSSLTDYDDAYKKSFFKSLKFLDFAHFGAINIFDHACVHRTLKQGGGSRVSLEIGLAIKDGRSIFQKSKSFVYEQYRNKYLPQRDVSRLGKTLHINVQETLDDAKNYKNKNFPRSRDEFEFVEV